MSISACVWIKRILLMIALFSCLFMVSCFLTCTHENRTQSTIEPQCDQEGYVRHTCLDCGKTFRTQVVPPLGHSLEAETTAPTCSTAGYTHYTCECGYSYDGDVVPPLGHDTTETVSLPDCTQEGYTDYACRRCDYTYRADWVAPLGHSFVCERFGPTSCTVTAHSEYTCTVCEYSYIGDFVFYSDVFEGAYASSAEPLAWGIDVSKYNHAVVDGVYQPLDFEAIAAAGIDFVILKIGSTPRVEEDGSSLGGLEPTFEEDYAAARAAGLDIGVYFYTYATTKEQTLADAQLLMQWLQGKQLEYPVYLDMEHDTLSEYTRRELTDLCLTFISELQRNRYFGALYTNNQWLTNYLQTDKVLFLFDVWYARYPAGGAPYVWNEELYGPHMGMWQYTPSGKIEGLSGNSSFDMNYAYKDYPAIMRALGYNGYDAP